MTEKQLNTVADQIHSLALELGIVKDSEATHLEIGSNFYGRAFRLALLKKGESAHYRHPLGDYLGMTKPETEAALGHIITALHAARNAQR